MLNIFSPVCINMIVKFIFKAHFSDTRIPFKETFAIEMLNLRHRVEITFNIR